MKETIHIHRLLSATLFSLFLIVSPLLGVTVCAQTQGDQIDKVGLANFMDGVVAAQLQTIHIPGAAVVVVENGKLIFAKGYGYADIEQQTPVVADQTLFRPGSVSKLFVWTAVMQLVEAGKIDLNTDINSYLFTFKIPAIFPQPITMAHLMAHTAGFEDQGLGTFAANAESLRPLEEYLSTHIPLRVRPPGELSAYSNYGAALAGYIVAQVSGLPFEQYMEEKILTPLQMTHSTFRQPLPDTLATEMAQGYLYANGIYEAGDFEFVQAIPAGSMSATATDLANFMIAHLQNGSFGETRILQESTAQAMHRQLFSHDPRVGGFAHGFMEMNLNGQHILMHGGDTVYFHSMMALLPERNIGLFVSYNSNNAPQAVENTLRALMDRYFPIAPGSPPAPIAKAGSRAVSVAGDYVAARSNESTPEKLSRLFQTFSIGVDSRDPTQIILNAPGQQPKYYLESEPFVYQSNEIHPDTNGKFVFRTDAQGQVTHLFIENAPFSAFIKQPWYLAASFQQNLLLVCILFFASVLIWGPIGFWIKRRFKPVHASWQRLASWSAGLVSLMSIAYLISFIILFSNPKIAFGLPPWINYLMFVPWTVALLALALLIFTFLAWRQHAWSLPGRIHYTLVTLAALIFVGWMVYWKLLGI